MKDWMRYRSGDWKRQPQTQIGNKIKTDSDKGYNKIDTGRLKKWTRIQIDKAIEKDSRGQIKHRMRQRMKD